MNIGETIKQCRSVKKLSMEQLSKNTGISAAHICLIENNKRRPTLKAVESIANGLGLPLSVLVFLADQRNEFIDRNAAYLETLSNDITKLLADAKE